LEAENDTGADAAGVTLGLAAGEPACASVIRSVLNSIPYDFLVDGFFDSIAA